MNRGIPLPTKPSDGGQQPIVTSCRDQIGHPFVTWRVPGGPCRRAWIERTHGQAGARFLLSVETDTIDGNAIGEPICHDMADLQTLLAYVWAALEPRR
jgi:hypothetical protein